MDKVKKLIKNLEYELYDVEECISLTKNIELVRKIESVKKLKFLCNNSQSALDNIINIINYYSTSDRYDFLIFALLLVVVDANRYTDAVLLSIRLQSMDRFYHTNQLSTNILLKEALNV